MGAAARPDAPALPGVSGATRFRAKIAAQVEAPTEHNTHSANLSWGRYAVSNLLIVNGEEVTTTAFGHWNAVGLEPTTLIG